MFKIEVEVDYTINNKRDCRHLSMEYHSEVVLPTPGEVVLELLKQKIIHTKYQMFVNAEDVNNIVVQSINDIHVHSIDHVGKTPEIWW
jgi:hypothetical protein